MPSDEEFKKACESAWGKDDPLRPVQEQCPPTAEEMRRKELLYPGYLCPHCNGLLIQNTSGHWRCQSCCINYTDTFVASHAAFRGVPITARPESIVLDDNQGPAGDTCHILHQGYPMCRFNHNRPVDWPKGHVWVSLESIRQANKGDKCDVNCELCFDSAVKELKR